MLKSWSIKNFKPIVDSGELQFAPVTVLAGRNSSGKSSLLQSILMIAQTLGSRLLDRPLLPNDRIVQLGTFEDILSEMAYSRTLELQFSLEMGNERIKIPPRLQRMSRWDIISANFFVKFNSATNNGTISSAIEASKVIVEYAHLESDAVLTNFIHSEYPDNKEIRKISFDLQKVSNDEVQHFLENVSPEQQRLVSPANENSNYLGKFKQTQERVTDQYLVTLSHFLPFRFIKKYNISERRKQVIELTVRRLFETNDKNPLIISGATTRFIKSFDLTNPLSQRLTDFVNVLIDKNGTTGKFSGKTLADLVHWTKTVKGIKRKREFIGNIQEAIVKEYLDNENKETNFEGLESTINDIYVENVDQAIEQITSFFTSKIRYLGPLRADPQASQKFGPSSELDDVGSKGEFAAAVYDANYAARIEWYNPQNRRVERGKLKEALDCWAQYLGVAQQVKTEMAGLSGVGWKIVPKAGRKPRSLPEVGVGVSQILPILVMGLLSPADCLLIIEQPELHLHPYVQARLGDFFMGLAKCKKQCLIETHSENLVSQLRLHIVEAGGLEKSDCMVYFVDQDERGAAKFEKIEISPNGNILNWPDGFFDETMLQEDRITAASVRKRAQQAKHDS